MSAGGAGRESVWDSPRPPRIEASARRVRVGSAGCAWPTAPAPTGCSRPTLAPAAGSSCCEWKGSARYHTVRAGDREAPRAAWSSPAPVAAFAAIAGHVAFSPALAECSLDGERVRPQEGGFSGGWITDEIVGPFKGGPGTGGW